MYKNKSRLSAIILQHQLSRFHKLCRFSKRLMSYDLFPSRFNSLRPLLTLQNKLKNSEIGLTVTRLENVSGYEENEPG